MLAVWSSDRSSLACQISRLTSVILGANEDNDSRSSLCLSHTLFFFSFSLFFVCLILSSLVYRTSWFRIYDSGLYGSVERNMLLCALDSLAFSSLCTPECQMKYQTPPWLITRFFLFLLFFSFYFSSFFILFLSQIESLSRRVFGQWQHPKRRKDLRRDKKVQNKKNKKK